MDFIWDAIKDLLKEIINSNLENMFTDVNNNVSTIAAQVGTTPQGWNNSIFNMIRNLSDTVVLPIAGLILTFVLCYELITMVTEKNNMHDVDTFMFFKYIFKCGIAVYLVSVSYTHLDVYKRQAVYIAIGINLDGKKDVLGMWVGENESAKFCHYGIIISNSKNRITCLLYTSRLSSSIKTLKRLYPQRCIWMRKRPICTFLLSR